MWAGDFHGRSDGTNDLDYSLLTAFDINSACTVYAYLY